MSTSWKRWTPFAAVPLVVVAAAVALPLSASAAGDLPDRSAADLLTFVAENDVTAFSGRIEQTSDLGLPDLSALGATGAGTDSGSATPADALLELATGSHQARVFVDAEQGARLQILDRLAERDIVATKGDGVWIYDSAENTATHLLPAGGDGGPESAPDSEPSAGEVPTPSSAAEQILASIDPTTSVAVGSDVSVAGRDAYELVLTPRDSDTLVGSVTISVDGETGLPLGVAVTAVGATAPAFSVAYSSIDLDTPDAAMFRFSAPEGATVTEESAPTHDAAVPETAAPDASQPDASQPDASQPGDPGITTTGTGWGTVVELPAGDAESLAGLDSVTTPVAGGRVLSSALLSVLITDDGRILAGAVPTDALLDAAAGR